MIKKLHNVLKYYFVEKPESDICYEKFPFHVLSSQDTIRYILKNQCSIARFGDGELDILLKNTKEDFQDVDEELKKCLKNVLLSSRQNLLVCLSSFITKNGIVAGLEPSTERYWRRWTNATLGELYALISSKNSVHASIYGDAHVTRPYMDWKYKSQHAQEIFLLLKQLWDGKNLLFIEGEYTRLGVGNDLFSNAKSIRRILCPPKNAFGKYKEIIREVEKNYKGELILMALGPTATILALYFAEKNIQAIDIGHIDIEYSWYLNKAKNKKAVYGKFTNEVTIGRSNIAMCDDKKYLSEIITSVK